MADSRSITRRAAIKTIGAFTALSATATTVLAKPKQTTFERVEAAAAELHVAMAAHYGDDLSEHVKLPENRDENEAAFVLVGIDKYGLGVHRSTRL